MQHSKQNRTLGRDSDQRRALLRGLATSLIRDGKIKTTTAKAKELRPFIERLVTQSKRDNLHTRRLVAQRLGQPQSTVVQKLFGDIGPRFHERNGGYTRIVKIGPTAAGRDEAVIEFVA